MTTDRVAEDADPAFTRIAVGINGYPEGWDAAVLAARLARASGAQLTLIAINPEPFVVVPAELGHKRMRAQAERVLRQTRERVAPDARTLVETNWSVPRALERTVAREHMDLLVVGSSRSGPDGRVQISRRTRQLLSYCAGALAVAPRGLSERPDKPLERIGVGYDRSPESRAGLSLAAALARSSGAGLRVRAVVDDRLPMVAWSQPARQAVLDMWDELLGPEVQSLREDAQRVVDDLGTEAEVEVLPGSPPVRLRELGEEVDLLVIGSRRWGAVARVLLGSTGERLMHDAACPVLLVPRPHEHEHR